MDKPVERGTDVNNLIAKSNTGSNTARIQTKDQMIETSNPTKSSGVQVQKAMKDMGCDGITTAT